MKVEKEISNRLLFLTEEMKKEVLNFIDFLMLKNTEKKSRKTKPGFKWEGALKNMKKEYTSVDLQHKIWEM
jgi:hypothetical protein